MSGWVARIIMPLIICIQIIYIYEGAIFDGCGNSITVDCDYNIVDGVETNSTDKDIILDKVVYSVYGKD